MQAAYFEQYGPIEVLRVGEQPTPVPGPNQILVRVRASSVNPVDWKVRNGDLKLLGASGGVGSFAVQMAQTLGAGEVTGVCGCS